MPVILPPDLRDLTEEERIACRRYLEAVEYGLEPVDAVAYACSGADTGTLRWLKEHGCPAKTAARILL